MAPATLAADASLGPLPAAGETEAVAGATLLGSRTRLTQIEDVRGDGHGPAGAAVGLVGVLTRLAAWSG